MVVRCEVLRAKVFEGARTPTVLGDPGPWLPLLIEATRLLATGEPARAATLRDAAFDAAPPSAATLDGVDADWLADADPRLGPTLEAIVEGRYVWVPYARLRRVDSSHPQDMRDQVWMPARFTWDNDGTAVGFIPTRYPAPPPAPTRPSCSPAAPNGSKPTTGPSRSANACSRPTPARPPSWTFATCSSRRRLEMSGIRAANASLPPLLDRLTDHAPTQLKDGPDAQAFTPAQLRQAVLRDLSNLMNTAISRRSRTCPALPSSQNRR